MISYIAITIQKYMYSNTHIINEYKKHTAFIDYSNNCGYVMKGTVGRSMSAYNWRLLDKYKYIKIYRILLSGHKCEISNLSHNYRHQRLYG